MDKQTVVPPDNRLYYSVLRGNALSSHEKTWRNFKCMLLSEKKPI